MNQNTKTEVQVKTLDMSYLTDGGKLYLRREYSFVAATHWSTIATLTVSSNLFKDEKLEIHLNYGSCGGYNKDTTAQEVAEVMENCFAAVQYRMKLLAAEFPDAVFTL